MKTYKSQERINKKLCIDCLYCNTYYPTLDAANPKHMCGKILCDVSGVELYSAEQNRNNGWCNGDFWELKNNIVVVEDENAAARANSDEWTDQFMDTARQIVHGKIQHPVATCGGLEEAIKRAGPL